MLGAGVQFQQNLFYLIGVIADLGDADDRGASPLGLAMGFDEPGDSGVRGVGCDHLAEHEPAILGSSTAVVQAQGACQRAHLEPAQGILGRSDEAPTNGHRGQGWRSLGVEEAWPVELAGKDALGGRPTLLLSLHPERLAHVGAGEDLYVEAKASHKGGGKRAFEIHRDPQGGPCRLHMDDIGEPGLGEPP